MKSTDHLGVPQSRQPSRMMNDRQYIKELESRCWKFKENIERLTARNEKLGAVLEAADALLHTDNPVTHELLWLGKVVGEVKTTEQNDD